jgi:DNA-binding Lrp family transcriptional regulator
MAVSEHAHDRLQRLERSGIIRQWTTKVDAPALGLGVLAFRRDSCNESVF